MPRYYESPNFKQALGLSLATDLTLTVTAESGNTLEIGDMRVPFLLKIKFSHRNKNMIEKVDQTLKKLGINTQNACLDRLNKGGFFNPDDTSENSEFIYLWGHQDVAKFFVASGLLNEKYYNQQYPSVKTISTLGWKMVNDISSYKSTIGVTKEQLEKLDQLEKIAMTL